MSTNGSKSTSTKYAETVNRATGAAGESDAPEIQTPASVMVRTVNDAELAKLMSDPTQEFAPQARSLVEGELIEGILEGEGPPAEMPNRETGVPQLVKTWIFASIDGGLRISILSTAQLDKKLPPFVGSKCRVVRGKDMKTGTAGRKVTEYMVSGDKRSDGTRRTWARPVVIDAQAIEAPATAGQLTSGTSDGEDARS